MAEKLSNLSLGSDVQKKDIVDSLRSSILNKGYDVVEEDTVKPWGAYFRIDSQQVETFINEFFPGLSVSQAKRGVMEAELSPKILLVSPGQRLSWQYHRRRAEAWRFLTPGAYHKSLNDEQGEVINMEAGDEVQFEKGDRHRLVGSPDQYVIVAEIWQHTDPNKLSDEDDIVRLQDDYQRA